MTMRARLRRGVAVTVGDVGVPKQDTLLELTERLSECVRQEDSAET